MGQRFSIHMPLQFLILFRFKQKLCFGSQVITIPPGKPTTIKKKIKRVIDVFKNGDNCPLIFLIWSNHLSYFMALQLQFTSIKITSFLVKFLFKCSRVLSARQRINCEAQRDVYSKSFLYPSLVTCLRWNLMVLCLQLSDHDTLSFLRT